MAWVCSVCSSNNLDTNAVCEICGEPRPAAAVAPKSTSVCTLTQTRAREKCNYADVTVPEEYNVIGEDAFKGRTDLYTIRIHSGVTKIMRGAFDGCTNLYSVYVDGRLSSIGARAFANCKYLSPEKRPTADTVAKDAFVGCSPTPIGMPSRTVGARPAAKKTGSTAAGYGRSAGASGTKTGTTTTSGSSPFTTEFSKTGARTSTTSTATKTGTSTATGTTATPRPSTAPRPTPPPPPRPGYTPPPPPRKAPAPPPRKRPADGFTETFIKLPLCLLIALAAFVGLFLFTDWGLLATREAWQTAGGLAAIFFVGMLTHHLYSEEKYTAIAGTLSVATGFSLLVWLFGGIDTTIAAILTLGVGMLCAIFSYLAFDNVKSGCGWWMALLGIGNLVNLIFVLIRFNYFVTPALWQVMIAEMIIIAAATVIHEAIDMNDYSFVIGISVFGFFAVGLVLWIFGAHATHLVSVLSLGLILFDVVGAVKSFDDYETGSGVSCIIFGVLQAALFVLTHIVYA